MNKFPEIDPRNSIRIVKELRIRDLVNLSILQKDIKFIVQESFPVHYDSVMEFDNFEKMSQAIGNYYVSAINFGPRYNVITINKESLFKGDVITVNGFILKNNSFIGYRPINADDIKEILNLNSYYPVPEDEKTEYKESYKVSFMCSFCYNLIDGEIETTIRSNKRVRFLLPKAYGVCECCGDEVDYIQIDKDISECISVLNKKGYKTKFCCAGHKSNTYAYILFKNEFPELDNLPQTWQKEYHDKITSLWSEDKQYLSDIYKWVQHLPDKRREEHATEEKE